MARPKVSQIGMLEHSKAKVDLFKRYFSIYLNIMNRTPFVKKIFLYDLFAGEGKYVDGGKGSPVIAMECIKDHYYSNNQTCPNIDAWFNDYSKSQIEIGKYKIERVEEFINKVYKPENVNLKFTKIDSSHILSEVHNDLAMLKQDERALLFVDPWGYKDIKPNELKAILSNGKTEIILFLPVSFMYRFADKALVDETFYGGKPLEEFLNSLFGGKVPNTQNQIKFIDEIKQEFKKFLGIKYVDTFTIERGSNNFFCLFFFTNNKTGYYKMLDAKWDLDEESGRGFKAGNNTQASIFDEISATNYLDIIKEFIKQKGQVTNQQLFDFGLDNGFLPKHTKKVLDQLKKQNLLEIIALDKMPVKGFYLDDNHDRKIKINLK